MPPKENKITLVMQRHDLSPDKLWLLWQKNLKKPRNPHPQPRRKIIQNQLGNVTRRVPMPSNLFTRLHIRHSESGRGTVGKVNQGDGIDFLACSFLVDDEEVCVASLCGGLPDFLESEVGTGAWTKGRAGEYIEEV
jgi:hypothetical protein